MSQSKTEAFPDADTLARSDPATLTLPDGRTLSYAEYGADDGDVVVYCHGNPGSRHLGAIFENLARQLGVRLVAPDRPGFGQSDFRAGRKLLDWPADVAALVDHLTGEDEEKFGVVGFSAGGPHALACAAELPERVERAVLASSATPPDLQADAGLAGKLLAAVGNVPGATRAAFGVGSLLANHWRSRFRAGLAGSAAPPDARLFEESVGDVLVADAAEAFRQGSRGPAQEFPLLGESWGFDPSDVEAPISLLHGERDERVDSEEVEALAAALPDADLTLVEEAHYSTLVRNREAILRAAVE